MRLNSEFEALVSLLPGKLAELESFPPHPLKEGLQDIPTGRGIYVFYDKGKPVYVGRTRKLRQRLSQHILPSSSHLAAALAFRMARRDMEKVNGGNTLSGSREDLLRDPKFKRSFDRAKNRIRGMPLRFVEVDEPNFQYLLEMYVALALKAEFNKFETH